jgi:NAD-dependent deacetylase
MKPEIDRAAADLLAARRVVALTGAGISVDSGIPPFRGKGGLWERYDPMEVGHIGAFLRDPEKVWRTLFLDLGRVVQKARPNAGHLGLVALERRGRLRTVITQNVDGLHQAAGNTEVVEFHGTFARMRCSACEGRVASQQVPLHALPPRCDCGGIYRPDCVLFGEAIPEEALMRSREASVDCDLLLVIGTSAEVHPAAMIPGLARRSGARVVEINPEATPLSGRVSEYRVPAGAGEAMPRILSAFDRMAAGAR